MTILLTRAAKGSELTWAEGDANTTETERRTGAGWRDYPFIIAPPEGSLYAPTYAVWEDDFRLLVFAPARRTDGEGTIHLDHDYISGTMVYPHHHWTLNTNNAGVSRWLFTWKFARRADSPTGIIRFSAAQIIVVETAVPANSAGLHMVSEPATGSGMYHPDFDVDTVIMLRVTRDGEHVNDTFEADAFSICGDAHARVDKIGTTGRTPPFLVDN